MDRDEFMELVYETFADEPDNVLANGIIEAADAYAEHEKAQLFQQGTTSDLISRQAAIDAIVQCTNCGDEDTLREYVLKHSLDNGWTGGILEALDAVKDLPSAQPEPKEGEWVQIQRCVGDTQPDLECPFCKHRIGWWDMGRYCAGCGAKLEGGAE